MKRTVYVVHSEWAYSSDGGHSVIEGVFTDKAAAEAHARATRTEYEEMGNTPWVDSDGEEHLNWDFDVHVCEIPLTEIA